MRRARAEEAVRRKGLTWNLIFYLILWRKSVWVRRPVDRPCSLHTVEVSPNVRVCRHSSSARHAKKLVYPVS